MNNKINITIEDFDEDHVIVFLEKNKKDMSFIFALFEFQNEMEYWDFQTKLDRLNGKLGYVFNKEDKPYLEAEITCFIERYNLNKYEGI